MPFADRPLPSSFEVSPIVQRKPKPVPPAGRAKGTANKFTRDIKQAVLQAAANVGDEDYGGRGLVGYCEDLARHQQRACAALLGKLMPMQLQADIASASSSTVHVHSVPVGHFLSPEEAKKYAPRSVLQIEQALAREHADELEEPAEPAE